MIKEAYRVKRAFKNLLSALPNVTQKVHGRPTVRTQVSGLFQFRALSTNPTNPQIKNQKWPYFQRQYEHRLLKNR